MNTNLTIFQIILHLTLLRPLPFFAALEHYFVIYLLLAALFFSVVTISLIHYKQRKVFILIANVFTQLFTHAAGFAIFIIFIAEGKIRPDILNTSNVIYCSIIAGDKLTTSIIFIFGYICLLFARQTKNEVLYTIWYICCFFAVNVTGDSLRY